MTEIHINLFDIVEFIDYILAGALIIKLLIIL